MNETTIPALTALVDLIEMTTDSVARLKLIDAFTDIKAEVLVQCEEHEIQTVKLIKLKLPRSGNEK